MAATTNCQQPYAHFWPFVLWGSDFWDVDSLGSSLAKGMNSGAPGKYLRRGSGTRRPWPGIISRCFRARPRHSNTYLLCLVVLEDAAHGPCRCAERGVQAVHVFLLGVRLLLGSEADLEGARLVIGAI